MAEYKHYKRQALTLNEYVLARVTLLPHFGTLVMATENSITAQSGNKAQTLYVW